MIKRRTANLLVLMSLCVLFAFSANSYACPMCKDSIPNSDSQAAGSLPGGFNNSVYLVAVRIHRGHRNCQRIDRQSRSRTGVKPGFPVLPKKD